MRLLSVAYSPGPLAYGYGLMGLWPIDYGRHTIYLVVDAYCPSHIADTHVHTSIASIVTVRIQLAAVFPGLSRP